LIDAIKRVITAEKILLVKGSRAQKMEVVVDALLNAAGK